MDLNVNHHTLGQHVLPDSAAGSLQHKWLLLLTINPYVFSFFLLFNVHINQIIIWNWSLKADKLQ
jgi:hypothetical protein